MRKPALCLLLVLLLSGCASPGGWQFSSHSEPPARPASVEGQPAGASSSGLGDSSFVLVDDPDSPYPMAVESWRLDLDGDGREELVELRAEKGYSGNETEPDKWFESNGMHPYTLVVTAGEAVYELPLGREDNDSPPLLPMYWDEERTGRGWTRDQDGQLLLVLWFDSLSRELDVYTAAFSGGIPALVPVPEDIAQAVREQRFDEFTD